MPASRLLEGKPCRSRNTLGGRGGDESYQSNINKK